ncbi:MAG: hypothetical protein DI604_20380 [Delftia acidovorans]|nr:MAG: hypothetical protein DI604_20380 [Delftia acidovorans]
MLHGDEDEKIVSELMNAAREWLAKADRSSDQRARLVAITEALNATGAAIAAIEIWRLAMLEERGKITGEPSMTFSAEMPPPITRH